MATETKVTKKKGNTYVTTPFRDKANFDLAYAVDQDVSELPAPRLAELIAAGVAETFAPPVVEPEPQK